MIQKRIIFYAFILLLFVILTNSVFASPEDNLSKKIDEYIQTAVAAGFSGAVLVAQGGAVILHKGYGLADRENNVPVRKETVFDMGSITKRFTRAAILKLEELGKLKRSDTLGKFLDKVPADKTGITIEQVLEHRAGFHEYHDTTGDFEEMDREQALKTILNQKLRFKPGDQEAYSNSGYTLLAAIIELCSKQSYQSFLREYLLKPAGMARTGFYRDPLWQEDEVAIGYEGRTIGEKNSPLHWPHLTWALMGGGGLVSSLGELYAWVQALESGKVLSSEAKAKMYDPQGNPIAYAGGNDFGFSSVVFEYPKEKNYVIVATNAHDNVSAPSLGRQISRILKGEEPQAIKQEVREKTSSPAGNWGLPDSPTGQRSRALLDAVNRLDLDTVQDFIKENLTPEFIGQFSMEEHLSIFEEIHEEMGEIELLSANKTGEFTAELLIQSKSSGQRLRIFLELESVEPYLISGLSMKQEKDLL